MVECKKIVKRNWHCVSQLFNNYSKCLNQLLNNIINSKMLKDFYFVIAKYALTFQYKILFLYKSKLCQKIYA